MTPEEAVAHKAQEQFDEYEREIAALRTVRRAAVAVCQLWFTDNAPDGSPHIRKAMLDLRDALDAPTPPAEGQHDEPREPYDIHGYLLAKPPAEGLDVERLARATQREALRHRPSEHRAHSTGWYHDLAERIAREYAALAPEQPE